MSRKLWIICLAIWFLMYGLLALTNIVFAAQGIVMGIVALMVAVLAILDR